MGEKPTKKKIVTLKVYKGARISLNEDGSVQNSTQKIKTEHNTNEWRSLMFTLSYSGYAKVEVEKVNYIEEGYPLCKDDSDIKAEVEKAFKPTTDVELTPDQKRIADLEAKLEALLKGKSEEKEVKEEKTKEREVFLIEEADTLEVAREKWEKTFGKKPFMGWKEISVLIEKQEKELNK